ncbi:MAG: hypothetical protein JXR91_09240 [Deltaproteobacteria bacterium]|nr:hypothetical protein [Deltaproteobacteria bacterium]
MTKTTKEINYPELFQKHLREMLKDLLEIIEKNGFPGNNHFYITFKTNHPEVVISHSTRAKYPKEMTIVLQHQYKGLEVEKTGFKVSLAFNGIWDNMYIPFGSISQFVDPYAGFLIPLEPDESNCITTEPLTLINVEDDNEASTPKLKNIDKKIQKNKIQKKDNLVFVDFTSD